MTSLLALVFSSTAKPAPVLAAASSTLDLEALVGAAGWGRLPAAVRRRFGPAHHDVTYVGRMQLRCSPAGRVLAALSRVFGHPLSAANADAVPAVVRVFGDGRGGMSWDRCFHLDRGVGATPHVVRSTKRLGADGRLFEQTDGGLGMVLDVAEDAGVLVFRSRSFRLVAGRWRIPVPTWLSPGACTVTHTDLGDGRFEFSLDMRHPVWGHTFHQSGVFIDPVERQDAPEVVEATRGVAR